MVMARKASFVVAMMMLDLAAFPQPAVASGEPNCAAASGEANCVGQPEEDSTEDPSVLLSMKTRLLSKGNAGDQRVEYELEEQQPDEDEGMDGENPEDEDEEDGEEGEDEEGDDEEGGDEAEPVDEDESMKKLGLESIAQHVNKSRRWTPDKEKTKTAFVAAGGDSTKIEATWGPLKDAVENSGISGEKEFAMFMANVIQETGHMRTREEDSSHFTPEDYDWSVTAYTNRRRRNYGRRRQEDHRRRAYCGKCCDDTSNENCVVGQQRRRTQASADGGKCKDYCTTQYYGRGYLMTTWKKNYEDARDKGNCGYKYQISGQRRRRYDIVHYPHRVVQFPSYAWCTASYYWKSAVHDDRCTEGCEMGNTVHAINGDQECGNGAHTCEARKRFCYYAKFYKNYSGSEPDAEPGDAADVPCISDISADYDTSTCHVACP